MNKIINYLIFSIAMSTAALADFKEKRVVVKHLQDISVTIKSESGYNKSEGSGVLIVRKIGGEEVSFVWTCAHVVDNLRKVRSIVGAEGTSRKVVEFKDAEIVKELVEGGRRVGEIKMDARVIKFSDYTHGHDLALLMVRARNYGKSSAKFYLNKDESIVPIGTNLFHVGSLLGQMGANSMTTGIVSQIGRIEDKVEFDQTTVAAFPGSSGGGVFLENGEYVGMIARGAGESFNLMIPVRRMVKFAKETDMMWALDPDTEAPSLKEIQNMSIEEHGLKGASSEKSKKEMNFLIKITNLKDDQ
jgi:S1-C subfamily serine protease